MYVFGKTEDMVIKPRNRLEFDYVVGNNLMRTRFGRDHNFVYTAVLYKFRGFGGDDFAFRGEQFAVFVYYIFVSGATYRPYAHIEAFVELISADFRAVVTARIVKEIFQLDSYGFAGGNFAGTDTSVKFIQTALFGTIGIFRHRRLYHSVVAENRRDFFVRTEAERAQKQGRGEFTRSVYFYPKHVIGVLFEFEPRASVGDNRRLIEFFTRLGIFETVVYAGGTNELRNDNAFRAVDDERTVVGHLRKFAHENVLIDDFARNLIDKPYFYL